MPPFVAWIGTAGAAVALASVAPLSLARADDPAPAPACVTRIDVVPAHATSVERTIDVPAVTEERCVPVIETVKVPVFEERRTPVTQQIDVPVMGTREVPVTAERPVPDMAPVATPVYETRREPVKLRIPNLFGCDDICLKLWDRCKRVQTGTVVQPAVVGWHTESVPAGTRTEQFVSGYEKQTVTVGERTEQVQVGTRDETHQVGTRNETVVVVPAHKETVRENVVVPAEPVTVVTQGDAKVAAPAPGTVRVMSEDEFHRAVASAR
jgi:hypothetical protein